MSAASGHDGADRSAPASTQAQAVKIGSYVLGETLGKGSFGKVKLATHETTGHRVAVKILNRQKIKSSQMDKKIKREITVLKMFRHPHIIRLYDVMETSSDIFMIMEYVNKGELFDYIVQNGKLSESAARRFFQQIVSGVEYCHHYQVAHRDLKPENLLLDNDLNVKIADFGLSNLMLDGDFLKTSCGSPNYAAPEVISGMLYAGPEVDVWSCGVILYALLCGRLPFDEDSIPALFQKIKAGKYNLPSSLPAGPRDIIQRILVVDPMRRMTLAEVRATEWFQAGLPPYLKMSPSQLVDDKGVDEAVVKQVAGRLEGVDEEAVRAEVQAGENGQQHDISLAYNILLDAKRRKELYELSSEEVAAAATKGTSGGGGGGGGGAGSAASGSGSGLASLSPSSLDGGLKGSLTQSAIPQSQLKSSPVIDMMMQMSATHTKSRYNKSKFVVPSSVPAYGSGTLKSPVSCSPPFKSYIRQGLSSQVMAKSAPGVPSFAASPTNVSSSLIQVCLLEPCALLLCEQCEYCIALSFCCFCGLKKRVMERVRVRVRVTGGET